jgi:F-type H+-transporting ATPase subunit b
MLIDWFTVGAQALNFLILVWLMKRFLYKPILHAIDEREKRIAAELADAAAKKDEAKKERDEFQAKNQKFDQERAALLRQATDAANAERQRLLEEARKAADALTAKRQETLRNDARSLNQAISRRASQEVLAIARKALADLATTSLEERMVEVFTRRLREMDGQAKGRLGQALKTASSSAVVRSAFELPPEQRATIQNAINVTFSADIHLRFETAPDLVGGIELSANGQKVAWNIADYLGSLEKGIEELLKAKDKPEPKAKVEAKPVATTEPIPNTKPEVEGEIKTEPKPIAQPAAKAAPEPGAKTEAEPAAKPAAKAAPESEAKAEPKSEAKPAPKTVPKPDSKPEIEDEVKTEPKSEPGAATTSAAKSQ